MFETKPWGFTIKLFGFPKVWLKFIVVKVGHRNSLHIHHERQEVLFKFPFRFSKIAKEEPHRLLPGVYFEFAYGKPREDDVLRMEDDYSRA